jgi:excinuclease UvrABC nuclease subunit
MDTKKVKWLNYEFEVVLMSGDWLEVAGIYIFTGVKDGLWRPYYIGQADNFKNRMASHTKWEEARKMGATHVHAMVVPQQAMRDTIEKEMIQRFQPPINIQLK